VCCETGWAMPDRRKATGARGEAVAARYLREQGYAVVEQNWRCARGEIDIVAREGATLVFVEVRTRTSSTTGNAEESVTPAKQRRLCELATTYLLRREEQMEPWDGPWRIDVVALRLHPTTGGVLRINHLRNAVEGS
jgi:putative endonuclease